MSRMSFELLKTDGIPRRGRLTFPRGTVETPDVHDGGYLRIGEGHIPEQIKELGAEIILGNTFHLYLRPASQSSRNTAACMGLRVGTSPSSPTPAVSRCSRWPTSARSPSRA